MRILKLFITTSLFIVSLFVGSLLRAEGEVLEIYYFDPLCQYDDITLSFVSTAKSEPVITFESEPVTLNNLNMIKFSTTHLDFERAQLKLTYTKIVEEETTTVEEIFEIILSEDFKRETIYRYYLRNNKLFKTAVELNNDISYATFDKPTFGSFVVKFKTIHPISDLTKITLKEGDNELPIDDIRLHGDAYFFNTDEIDIKKEYILSIDFLEPTIKSYYVRYDFLYDDGSFIGKYNYFGNDLGANFSETSTTFKLWAPLLERVILNIYSADGIKEVSYLMIEGNFGVFERRIPGNLKNKEYTFSFERYGKTHEIIDPNAKYISHDNTRGVIVNPVETNPRNFKKYDLTFSGNYVDAVIYEASISKLTQDDSITANYKNTFYALTRTNATHPVDSEIKIGIKHLVDLGITHISFNDLFDDAYSLMAPNNEYKIKTSSKPKTMSELKSLIHRFNEHDIGVIYELDINKPVIEALELLMPGYYYEHIDGKIIKNDGNATFNFSNYMVENYISSTVNYLVDEYNLAGVKLTPLNHFKVDGVNEIYQSLFKENPKFIMYGEFGADPQDKVGKINKTNLRSVSLVGVVDNRFKVLNNFFGEGPNDLKEYLLKEPSINFQTANINQTFNKLPDLSSYKESERAQALYMNMLAFGVPIIKAGDEFNDYSEYLTYDYRLTQWDFHRNFKELIKFRQTQKSLKLEEHSDVKKMVLYKHEGNIISIQITNLDNQYPELLIIYKNKLTSNEKITLPVGLDTEEKRKPNDGSLDWRTIFSNDYDYLEGIYESEYEMSLNNNQTLLLHFGEITGKIVEIPPRIPEKPQDNSSILLKSLILVGVMMVVGGVIVTYFILKPPKEKNS